MKLFILISDGGDGSYYPKYTDDFNIIERLQQAYDEGKMQYDNGIGVDGDGFHYDYINIPDGCTAESLGLAKFISMEYANSFFNEEE